MDIKNFQDSRNAKLVDFQKSYNFLKIQYSTSLLAAIQETDPASQQQMISTVLNINSELSSLLREILGELNKGDSAFNTTTINDLTSDLIEYQKQYQEITQRKNKLQTLKLIYASNRDKLETATHMYNIYLGSLILLIFVIIYLVMRTAWTGNVVTTIQSIASPLTQIQVPQV
jgi:hypothetical protein